MSETTTTYVDKALKCCEPDCKADFTWTAGEQEWFAQKQDPNSGKPFEPPRRCKTCRERLKQEREYLVSRGWIQERGVWKDPRATGESRLKLHVALSTQRARDVQK